MDIVINKDDGNMSATDIEGNEQFQKIMEQQRKLRENQEESPENNPFKDLTNENPFVRDLSVFVDKAFNIK